jgi:pimeloyl-ACP methyl ester carboxylesterase
LRRQIGRIVAIDLVGRGESTPPTGLPEGKKFGELTIEDNVSTVIQAIGALRERGYAPKLLMGHSMGGLAVVSVQEALTAQGSSLAKLGIEQAILIAPVPPHARPWMMGPSADLSPFIKQSDALGSYLELSPEAWIAQAYSTTAGTLASNAPTPQQASDLGYVAIEPLVTVLQLVESPIPLPDGSMLSVPRPSVRQGAFNPEHGTELTLLGFSQDILVPFSTLGDLYTYLTGQPEATGYRAVTAPDAVHNAFVSNPSLVVQALLD